MQKENNPDLFLHLHQLLFVKRSVAVKLVDKQIKSRMEFYAKRVFTWWKKNSIKIPPACLQFDTWFDVSFGPKHERLKCCYSFVWCKFCDLAKQINFLQTKKLFKKITIA